MRGGTLGHALVLLLLTCGRVDGGFPGKVEKKCDKYDVLILGAGAAGVAAAQRLTDSGVTNFLVLEGADYIGGRMRNGEIAGKTVEMGANWVSGTEGSWLWELCQRYGINTSTSDFDSWRSYDEDGRVPGKKMRFGKFLRRVDRADKIAERLKERNGEDQKMKATMAVLGWQSENKYDDAVEVSEIDYEYTLGLRDTSLRYARPLDAYVDFKDEDRLVTDQRGWNTILSRLAKDSGFRDKIKLNKLVVNITDSVHDGVLVETSDGKSYEGKYVIVTFSLGVLQSGVVNFQPPLPVWKQSILQEEEFGVWVKVFLQFERQFWPDLEYLQYVDDLKGWYPIWTNFNHDKHFGPGPPYIIMVVLFDQIGVMVERQGKDKTVKQAVKVLKKMFPKRNIPDPIDALISEWASDPLTHGAYTTGDWLGFNNAKRDLRRQQLGHVYFGGEAMSTKYVGWVHGGLYSGNETAEAVLKCLSGDRSPLCCRGDYDYWERRPRTGCMHPLAINFNPLAEIDDQSCMFFGKHQPPANDQNAPGGGEDSEEPKADGLCPGDATELQSSDKGWLGKCEGLKLVWASWFYGDPGACRRTCEQDPLCGVWQVDPVGVCRHGQGYQCITSWGPLAPAWDLKQITAAGMVVHGQVDVVTDLRGYQVLTGLRLVEHASRPTHTAIHNCQSICYANPRCSYWQYHSQGCSVEDPAAGFVAKPDVPGKGAGAQAGEKIRHFCQQLQRKSSLPEDLLRQVGLRPGAGATAGLAAATAMAMAIAVVAAVVAVVRVRQRHRNYSQLLHAPGSSAPVHPTEKSDES